MLIWPALALLKKISNAHISVLVPVYTAPMAHLCPSIDSVLIDPGPDAVRVAQQALLQQIKEQQFDCAIAVFSNGRNARMLWQAKIPNRFSPATKWAQLLYNHRLRQRRSQSMQPEWRYNVDLIRFALKQQGYDLPEDQIDVALSPPYLSFEPQVLSDMRHQVAAQTGLNVNHRWLIVHPGSGGSARNLVVTQYAQFIYAFLVHIENADRQPDYLQSAHSIQLDQPDQQDQSNQSNQSSQSIQSIQSYQSPHLIDLTGESFDILVTAGPSEAEQAQTLVQALTLRGLAAAILPSHEGLKAFAQVIANGALFLASSTGPLHIAGALDVPTVGVYTARRSATALRWQPINQKMHHWPISVPEDAEDPEDLRALDWAEQGVQAGDWFDRLSKQTEDSI